MPDFVPPSLLDLQLPSIIDVSKNGFIEFKVSAQDQEGGSGLKYVTIELDRFFGKGEGLLHLAFRPGVASADGQLKTTDTFSDATPDTANLQYSFGPSTPTGTVNIVSVWVVDHEDRARHYSASDLQQLGYTTQVSVINSAAPPAPLVEVATAPVEGSVRTLAGSGTPGHTVHLVAYADSSMTPLGTAIVGTDGKWTITTATLADGLYERAFAWAVDPSGNASATTAPFNFDVWKDGLLAPQFAVPTDAGGFVRVTHPIITGVAAPKATVTLYADGVPVGTDLADDAGLWQILTDTLSEGAHVLTATQTTLAGRTSVASAPRTVQVDVQEGTGIQLPIAAFSGPGTVAGAQAHLQHVLDDLAARLTEVLEGDIRIPVKVTIKDLPQSTVGTGGSAWSGIDPATGLPSIIDAGITINTAYPALFTPGMSPPIFLFAHEIMHALGFTNVVFDELDLVKTVDGVSYFHGANAMAIYGGPVPLSPDGSHLQGGIANIMDPGGGSLLDPHVGMDNPTMPFTHLEIAMLKDIGWDNKIVLQSADGHTFIAGSNQAGRNSVSGTPELDTLFVAGNSSDFTGSWEGGMYKLSNATDLSWHGLESIERIQFGDRMMALDVDSVAGQAYRLYRAALDRAPDEAGLGYWIKALDNGLPLLDIATLFIASAEFQQLLGPNPDSATIVTQLYQNVLHRAPDQAGFDFWVPILNANPHLVPEFLVGFSESQENQDAVAAIIGNGFTFLPYP